MKTEEGCRFRWQRDVSDRYAKSVKMLRAPLKVPWRVLTIYPNKKKRHSCPLNLTFMIKMGSWNFYSMSGQAKSWIWRSVSLNTFNKELNNKYKFDSTSIFCVSHVTAGVSAAAVTNIALAVLFIPDHVFTQEFLQTNLCLYSFF